MCYSSHMESIATKWVDLLLEDIRIVRLYSEPVLSPPGDSTGDVFKGSMQVHDHDIGARQMAQIFGCKVEDLPNGLGWQTETLSLNTHEATHVDAPIHYHPSLASSSSAPGIDTYPTEQFVGHAVVLDLRGFANGAISGYFGSAADIARDRLLSPERRHCTAPDRCG